MIVHSLHHSLQAFFSRNIFERLICYIFLTELFVKVFFELAQGQWFYVQSQHKQYIFYSFIMFDYLLTLPRVINLRIRLNYVSLFLLVFLCMIVQGVFVGVINSNRPFEIFNDTVPLLVLCLNALRMQSYSEATEPVNFNRLFLFCGVVGALTCLFGKLALLLGLPSQASVGALTAGLYFPMFFAALVVEGKVSFRHVVLFLVILGFSAMNMNRTTMAFIVLAGGYFVLLTALRNPVKGVLVAMVAVVFLGSVWALLPEDSGTYRRIVGLGSVDFEQTSGSIGERKSEMISIAHELRREGKTAQLFGMGHGGLYEVQFTHEYLTDYGHAHYSWALYNLRYGISGYIYLSILAAMLLFHAIRNLRLWVPVSVTVAFICIQSFMYLGTYVNFVFLLAGLQFLYLPGRQEQQEEARQG